MLDRNGKEVRIGEIVKIVGQYDVPLYNYWIVTDFMDYGLAIDVVLCHYNSNQIRFINILDIERPFGE